MLKRPTSFDAISDAEWVSRVNLAACYRLVAHFRWDDLIFTHISARVPGSPSHFLINPYGLMFEEITASNLVKVDHSGIPLEHTDRLVNPAGFLIHSAIHEAREDVQCVIHTHTPHGIAVSAQEDGLLPISQQSSFPLRALAYHNYEGLALREAERARLVADLGASNNMILRNHGLLTCGRSIPEAFIAMYTLEMACRVQILAQSGGSGLTEITQSVLDGMNAQAKQVTMEQGADLLWPSLLRRLDRIDSSFRN